MLTLMDEVGHTDTQAPQPLHSSRFKFGCATFPIDNWNWIAMVSHISPQLLHSTFWLARQVFDIEAFAFQGVESWVLKSFSGQASAH
ncbi:hypothetical protein VIBNISFn135_1200036 [Vibrio nigripulchritudo SFn135]|nr:hypothetical protein VIBNISFn135_1200036 [Vibrio nigripulchritudo SFn135]